MHHLTDRITHTTAFNTPGLAGMKNISMGSPRWIDPTTHHTMSSAENIIVLTVYLRSGNTCCFVKEYFKTWNKMRKRFKEMQHAN